MTKLSHESRIEYLVAELRKLDAPLANSAAALNARLANEPDSSVSGARQRYWELLAIVSAVSKVRVLIRDNLHYIETLSLLALTRYVFELVVCLKQLQNDPRFCLLIAREAFELQVKHFSALASHLQREASLYKRLGADENRQHEETARSLSNGSINTDSFADRIRATSDDVDRQLAENFAIYADDVLTNGYGFQAYLIEKKALSDNSSEEQTARATLAEFNSRWGGVLGRLSVSTKWWKRAELVGMQDEYDFIYTYTSRLLHATPASYLTLDKSLTPPELLMFLRYVRVQLIWVNSFAAARAALNA